MTVSVDDRKSGPYVGNGSNTTFSFDFRVFNTSDVVVTRTDNRGVETVLHLSRDYSVSLTQNGGIYTGGSVVLNTAPATDELITITGDVPETQEVVLTNLGGFYPDIINGSLDRLTILTQQISEKVSRSVKVPVSSSINPDQLINEFNAYATSSAVSATNANTRVAATIQDLLSAPTGFVGAIFVNNYHANIEGGGGSFYWDASKSKSAHNGGTVIDPNIAFPLDWSNQTQLTAWFTAATTGSGCWVRAGSARLDIRVFGAICSGVVDDAKAINQAIKANSDGGVLIPAGVTTAIASPIFCIDGLDLSILGTVKMLSGSRTSLIDLSNSTNVRISGPGILDGNSANVGTSGYSTVSGGVVHNSTGAYASNILISNLTIQNMQNWPVNITYVNKGIVQNCILKDSGNSVEFALNANDCWFMNNYVSGIRDLGLGFYGTCTGGGAIGNEVTNCTSSGLFCLSDNGQPGISTNILLQDNYLHDLPTTTGVVITSNDNTSANPLFHKNITVKNNLIYKCVAGIYVSSIDPTGVVSIKGNTIIDCYDNSASTAASGAISTSARGGGFITITDNDILDMNGATYLGIFLNNAANTIAKNNYIYDGKATPTMKNGIYGSLAKNSIVSKNVIGPVISGTSADSLVFASVDSTSYITDNLDIVHNRILQPPSSQDFRAYTPRVSKTQEGSIIQTGVVTILASSVPAGSATAPSRTTFTLTLPETFPVRVDSVQFTVLSNNSLFECSAVVAVPGFPLQGPVTASDISGIFNNFGAAPTADVKISWMAIGR